MLDDNADLWAWMATIEGQALEDGVEELTRTLAAAGEAQILRFSDQLSEAVYALDTPAHYEQVISQTNPEGDDEPLQMFADVFLYARLAVVASGRRVWEQVLADPARFARGWPVDAAEGLLDVAERALHRATGMPWEHTPAYSMQTSTNYQAWGTRAPLDEPVSPEPTWLAVGGGYGDGVRPWNFYYPRVLSALASAIDQDPLWVDWWSRSGVAMLSVQPMFEISHRDNPALSRTPRMSIRKGHKIVEATGHFDGAHLATNEPNALRRYGREDLRHMLTQVGSKLGLGALPNLPDVPPVDEAAPEPEYDRPLSVGEKRHLLAQAGMSEADIDALLLAEATHAPRTHEE